MKNLNQMYEHAMEIVEKCGIEVGDIADVTINTRAKRRFGQCTLRGGRYYINISSFILTDETVYKAVLETIIHEILHTCKGCMNHGNLWKAYANKIKVMTGYHVTRTTSREEFGLDERKVKNKDNYVFVCEDCGQVIRRSRFSKFCQRYHNYKCGKCGGKFIFDSENSKQQILSVRQGI